MYLLTCGRDIERNPVKANMVGFAWEYGYSSAKYYALGEEDGLTAADPGFAEFGKPES